jgi:hypothetical protein
MMLDTCSREQVDAWLVKNYFLALIDGFFKILPMREADESTLPIYMRSLQISMLGCKELVSAIHYDAEYLSLLSILQYLIDNPSCEPYEVKREIFKAISICKKLVQRYTESRVTR